MDLDDSFTERLMQRAKARKDYLLEKKNEMCSAGKKRDALEENKLNSGDPDQSPKRQCTEASHSAISEYNKENVKVLDEESCSNFVPYHSVAKTRGLAALKTNFMNGDDDDDNSNASTQQTTPTSVKSPVKNTNVTPVERSQPPTIQPVQESDAADYSDDESIDEDDFAENYADFRSDDGSSKMELDLSPAKQVKGLEKQNEPVKSEPLIKPKSPDLQKLANSNVDPAELPLAARKALFEKALLKGTPKINDDVVNHKLSVAQRAAMFENASKTNSGAKNANFKEPKRIAFSNFEKFEKRNNIKSPVKTSQPVLKSESSETRGSPVKKIVAEPVLSPVKKIVVEPVSSSAKKIEPISSVPSPTKNVGSHTRLIQQKLIESSGSCWQEKQAIKAAEERKQEISSLVNHWEKLSSSSSVENNSETERPHLASEEKVSCDSDASEEVSESEEECEPEEEIIAQDLNGEIDPENNGPDQESVYEEDEQDDDHSAEKYIADDEVFSDEEAESEIIKSVEEDLEKNSNIGLYHPKSILSSISTSGISYSDDSYQASSSRSCASDSSARSNEFRSCKTEEVFEDTSDKRGNKNPEINLLRTVSAYRREKQETKLTPVRTVVRREKTTSPESPPDTDFTEVIQQRLKELQDEILRQQTVISQTSQALNLCSATAEFSGSTEQVEGERLLLIATQKRQACLNEINRLKTCGAQGENVADGTGTLTISDLQLPLKREFVATQLEGRGDDTVHYFLCLIRHGVQVIVTQMISSEERTSDGVLNFTNHIQLRSLPADFSVIFEVYALQTKKEVLPHEKKYHIKRENSKKRLTPKGKKFDGKILLPAISSPGGPSAVRSPSFGVVGYTRFTLHNCNKNNFTLDKVPFTSPLEGVLRVKLQLHAEHKVILKGFLTFYEDVGDRGALYRRWCVLDRNNIAYWLYPDDEHKKEPIGIIDLKQCVTGLVKAVPSLECARPHTFKLVTVRPQKKGDKNTLISRTINTLTTTKHLLTADTKDERILWCNKINEALSNVRKWDPQALRPIETMQI